MKCELVPNSEDACVMKSSPNVPSDTVTTSSCVRVDYHLSSDDVILTANIFVGDEAVVRDVTFRADEWIKYIRLSDLPSMDFTVTFVASRIPHSVERTLQFARIEQVQLGPCSNGMYYHDDGASSCIISNSHAAYYDDDYSGSGNFGGSLVRSMF